MKNTLATRIILLSLLFMAFTSFRGFADNKTERVLEDKTFPVKPDAELAIDHEFGNLECLNWDKDEISVKITARVDSDNPDKVEKALGRVSYDISGNSDRVSIRCRLNKGNGNPNVSVDVQVMMPKTVSLDVKHKFGNGFIESAEGLSKIESQYGSMKIQELSSPESKVKIDFGEGKVTHMAGGDISVSYGSLWLGSSDRLTLDLSYSNGEIETVKILDVKQEGGELKLSSVDDISGSSGFGSLKIGNLNGSLDMRSEYGNLTVRSVSKDFSSINLKNSFGSGKLVISESATYQLDAEAEYGSVDFPESLANITYREKSMAEVKYKGIIGHAPEAKSTVTITSEYGSVNLLANE
jgi:hypothetical protein